ncbi:hypothetical protein [Streptomyces sp. HUAS TT20]|uniref:hypothetical protein n=1 Tax=Streptomyces sp. HUAS TT20 TaxID=3447509 RepID=UPI0021D7DD52|nr:hypothetical protein [Streptomyces sp. HUAS 15-9]UXY31058.1 hypothetical protein N8I87_33915 [Streptomyces sp. HUAS 15-9]
MRAFARRTVGSKTVWGSMVMIVLFAVSACSTTPDRAVSDKQLRKLGESGQAVRARDRAEQRLRGVARTYADRTPLSLGLVVVHDVCVPGSGPGWFFQQKTDDYKVVCSMNVTAYYGADPRHMGDTLDGILTVGDHARSGSAGSGSPVPFTHDDHGKRLVAYYQGQGPNPHGPQAPEPTRLAVSGQLLTWDTTHGGAPRRLVEEPYAGLVDDPPVSRVVRDPKNATVAAIRKRYGSVFKLEFPYSNYYWVLKNGRTRTE